jgi:hypothetical protein
MFDRNRREFMMLLGGAAVYSTRAADGKAADDRLPQRWVT